MSSPACADGYDTPAQQREDSTTFMNLKKARFLQDRDSGFMSGASLAPQRHGPEHRTAAVARRNAKCHR